MKACIQAVRLPKEFRLTAERVQIFRQGGDIVLREHPANVMGCADDTSKP
jgi:antitoxin VapB